MSLTGRQGCEKGADAVDTAEPPPPPPPALDDDEVDWPVGLLSWNSSFESSAKLPRCFEVFSGRQLLGRQPPGTPEPTKPTENYQLQKK